MIDLIVNAWPLLVAIAAAIVGLTGYLKKVLEIREVNAKFRELQNRQRDRDRRVHTATPEEIERYAPPPYTFKRDLSFRLPFSWVSLRVVCLAVALLLPALTLMGYYFGTLSQSASLENRVAELEAEVVSLSLESAEYKKTVQALQQEYEKLKRHTGTQSKELP